MPIFVRAARSRPTSVLALAFGLSAWFASGSAAAQSSLSTKFPVGFAIGVFEPSPAGDRFFAVADAASATDGRLRVGLVGDVPALKPLLERTDDVTGQKASIITSQVNLHAGAAYPITSFLHANLDIPFVASQSGDTSATPKGGVFGDPRIGLRANVMSPAFKAFAFGPAVDMWIPIGSESNLAGDGKVRVNPRLGISGKAGVFVYAANGGYLVREKVDTGSLEYGDAVTFGGAVGLSLFDDVLQVGPELWGRRQVNPLYSDTKHTELSSLFGAKARFGDFVAGFAGGPGLTDAPGVAPRFVVSLALAPKDEEPPTKAQQPQEAEELAAKPEPAVPAGPADGDGDGIPDDKDACPDKLGNPSDDPTKNGCPKPHIADADGDGIRDELDACPDQKGAASDDKTLNGCPPKIVDTDGDGVADAEDACPSQKGQTSSDPATNGCPPPNLVDTDGDGIPDTEDACPQKKGAPTTDPKTNGCKPAKVVKAKDSDHDGIADTEDACPHQKGVATDDPATNGCKPKKAVAIALATAGSAKPPAGEGAAVTFAGFHVDDNGMSHLYVQLTAPVQVEATVTKTHAEYRLVGAKIPVKNNKNPLLAQNFVAEVVSARLVPEKAKGHGKHKTQVVRLVVDMRESVSPTSNLVQNADGSATLMIDFPRVVKAVKPPADPKAPGSEGRSD